MSATEQLFNYDVSYFNELNEKRFTHNTYWVSGPEDEVPTEATPLRLDYYIEFINNANDINIEMPRNIDFPIDPNNRSITLFQYILENIVTLNTTNDGNNKRYMEPEDEEIFFVELYNLLSYVISKEPNYNNDSQHSYYYIARYMYEYEAAYNCLILLIEYMNVEKFNCRTRFDLTSKENVDKVVNLYNMCPSGYKMKNVAGNSYIHDVASNHTYSNIALNHTEQTNYIYLLKCVLSKMRELDISVDHGNIHDMTALMILSDTRFYKNYGSGYNDMQLKCIELLLREGADPNKVNVYGESVKLFSIGQATYKYHCNNINPASLKLNDLYDTITPDTPYKTVCDKDDVDNFMRALVEGCVFVNNPYLTGLNGTINGEKVHLCSKNNNPGYNDISDEDGNILSHHKIKVDIVNRRRNSSNTYNNEHDIIVYCYDTDPSVSLNLLNKTRDRDNDYYRFIKNASVTVSHSNGENILIECNVVNHTMNVSDYSNDPDEFEFDNRSKESSRYTSHGIFGTYDPIVNDTPTNNVNETNIDQDGCTLS